MRNTFFLLFLTFFISAFSQQALFKKHEVYAVHSTPEFLSFNNKTDFSSSSEILKYLESQFLDKDFTGQKLELDYIKISPTGKHYRYKHLYNGMSIYGSSIQFNLDNTNNLFLIINCIAKFDLIDIPENYENKGTFWMNTSNGLTPATSREIFDSSKRMSRIYFYNNEGNLLFHYNPKLYFNLPDSMVSAMVYLPNPIVAANTNYGEAYVDNGDKNTSELSNARSKVRVPLLYSNGKFKLSNGLVTLKNLNDPKIEVIEPTDTFLNFNRDQPGFEDINAFYHLNNYSNYIKKIGFGALLDTIFVDTHGAGGDDNSFLDPSKKPLELEYGTGNVDDAEDGQVVVHEFGHSLSVIASPNTVSGNDRLAMEEGQADYVCMSYSRSLSKNKPYQVFSWDGHNEFWGGFNGKSQLNYKNRTGVKDVDRDIWSTALLCMHDKLRRSKCDSLIFSYYFLQAVDGKMPQMAKVILKLDSLMFGAKELGKIWQCFTDQGILDTVPRNIGIKEVFEPKNEIKFINTHQFSYGLGDGVILFDSPQHWKNIEIYNSFGQMLNNYPVTKEILLAKDEFIKGVYFVRIISVDGFNTYIHKIIKY